ncbi:glycosyltransferase family 4 protein [Microbacterium esteraromaticum]|uniref:glycosyltransferase family 4 protein n=1 Tax=Microbacterium esteraromaticum TaxID=57043 RepID=UPI001CD1A954|nr:glycosyltransferase family 4 protein [Microbacterium esteraromaticum]MCA1305498.1 glycosyltransferase family 4 protein [Microbacterium esteraromaticum]
MSRRVIFFDHAGTPGGGQLSAARLLPLLQEVEPIALYLTGGSVAEQMRESGIRTTVLEPTSDFSTAALFRYAHTVAQYLRTVDPSVPVVAMSTAAAQVLALVPRGRRPRLLRLSEDMQRYQQRGIKSLAYFRLIFPRFDGFLSNSEWTSSTIPASLRTIPVRLAYPLSGVQRTAQRSTPVLEEPTVRIACFSRAARWKGLDLAIDAVGRLTSGDRPVQLTIFGGEAQSEPDYAAELRQTAQRSGAEVVFAGHVDDVLTAMQDVDIVIMPSRLPEPFGQVTVQSLAAGCLTVVSAHGGSLEIVEDQRTGLTFPPDDASGLHRVLAAALNDSRTASSVAEAGCSSASRFTDAALARDFESAMLALLS